MSVDIYDEFEAMRFLYQDREAAANTLGVISEIQGKDFICDNLGYTGQETIQKIVMVEVPILDLNKIISLSKFMLQQSTENMSEANKENVREILREAEYAKKRQK